MNKLSEWVTIDGHCATRVLLNTNPNDPKNRVAVIEKTPRIRLDKNTFGIEQDILCVKFSDKDAWLYGPKGSSDYGKDVNSRKWCDNMLILLGYTLG